MSGREELRQAIAKMSASLKGGRQSIAESTRIIIAAAAKLRSELRTPDQCKGGRPRSAPRCQCGAKRLTQLAGRTHCGMCPGKPEFDVKAQLAEARAKRRKPGGQTAP